MTAASGTSRTTAVVLTLNEERHLPDCLASLDWADEVLVLDSGSTDRTVSIATEAGSRVETHSFENYSRQRQHALSLASADWVLFVDADERVPEELAREIRSAVSDGHVCGYSIPRRNVFWGHVMLGGGWWPDHQLRLLRRDRATYDPDRAVHEVAHVDGVVAELESPLVHLNYDDLAEFRRKQHDYAMLDAYRRLSEGWPLRRRQLLLQPLRELIRRYIKLDGWRDGRTGLAVCVLMAWYEAVTLLELRRLQREAAGAFDQD